MVSDDVVVVIATVLAEVKFDFEVFPLMVCISQEFNVDCMCYINQGNVIINKGLVRAYLYKSWLSL
jgi:hypothetical protein